MEIVIDVWEGSLEIDEPTLLNGGVKGLIIRLNDMNGGHHMDQNFTNQWVQAENFLRAPYFVYNPWENGKINFEWMADHLPKTGVTRVMADVEVRKSDYSPITYADEVSIFFDEARKEFPLVFTYTGQWFLSYLSHWDTGDYCWARYPYVFYPVEKTNWSWELLRQKVNWYGYNPDPYDRCPGNPALWQCSGDRLILPGTANRPIDIILWKDDLPSLETWWGAKMPLPPGMSIEQKTAILWREAVLHGWNLAA